MKISEIKADARLKLKDRWGRAAFIVLGFVIFNLAVSFAGSLPLLSALIVIGSIVITVPINYGLEKSFFEFYHGKEVSLFDFVGYGFKNFSKAWSVTWNKFLALLLPTIITIISGVVAIFAIFSIFFQAFFGSFSGVTPDVAAAIPLLRISMYSFSIYVVSAIITAILSLKYVIARLISIDNPELTGKECIDESRNLMSGNILKYIFLNLSFIGWAFLSALTFGIGMFWLAPYMQVSIISFYRMLKPEDKSVLYQVDDLVNE